MEFCEKLQELRKEKGMTQEELAESLFVSRSAVSKWESGKGYPNIDSIKDLSDFFSVSIDDLLSGEKLISIAEKEKRLSIQKLCGLLFGIVDLLSFLLIVLPLYPNPIDGYIYSVNLFAYSSIAFFSKSIYWILFLVLILLGATKIILIQCGIKKCQSYITNCSIGISILAVLFLSAAKEPYAIVFAFMLLILKTVVLFMGNKK